MITERDLGGWLIRANPRLTDLAPYLGPERRPITGWCVHETYRLRLMRPGQKVVFWVTGAAGTRGVHAVGWTTGAPAHDEGHRPRVPLTLTPLDDPVRATVLAATPELAGLEVLRAPQMSNPSWISRAEMSALAPLLGPWPAAPG